MAIYTTNNKIWKLDNKWVNKHYIDPYNPLDLPPNTIRCKFMSWYRPVNVGDSRTLVDSTNNIWDIYKQSNDWYELLYGEYQLIEVLGANTSNVTNMSYMFAQSTYIQSLSLFDTSRVTNMDSMFYNCSSLTSIPLFNTSSVTNMNNAFYACIMVESGALALYQQASSQAIPPTNHTSTFSYCGIETQTGLEELQQIPSDWK